MKNNFLWLLVLGPLIAVMSRMAGDSGANASTRSASSSAVVAAALPGPSKQTHSFSVDGIVVGMSRHDVDQALTFRGCRRGPHTDVCTYVAYGQLVTVHFSHGQVTDVEGNELMLAGKTLLRTDDTEQEVQRVLGPFMAKFDRKRITKPGFVRDVSHPDHVSYYCLGDRQIYTIGLSHGRVSTVTTTQEVVLDGIY